MWDLLHIIMPNLYHTVTYNQTIARQLEFAVWRKRNNLHLKLSSWITQDVKIFVFILFFSKTLKD